MERIKQLVKELSDLRILQTKKDEELRQAIQTLPVNPNLLFFYGDGCPFTKRAEPAVIELESSIGARLTRLETWNDSANQKKYDDVGGMIKCGGVPYFHNTETGESLCGVQGVDILKAWARISKVSE